MATEHGFKQEQGEKENVKGPLNKRRVDSKTPKNKNNRRSSPKGRGKAGMDPALLAAIVAMLQSRGAPGDMGGMPSGGMNGPGAPMSLPPGAVPMGPPMGNPAMGGRMGLMPPMSAAMPPGGPPVR